ncbi:MAG: S-layer protein, partial [Pirellula sp.]
MSPPHRHVLLGPLIVAIFAIATFVGCLPRSTAADFENEIQPLLTRYGCNSGGCHGKASGQNGFKLSLFGFDTKADYEEIVQHARGRRVNVATPDQSLLLQKSIGATPHGGGTRFGPTSEAYQILRQWISDGAPAASPSAPRLTAIRIEPIERSLQSGEIVNLH